MEYQGGFVHNKFIVHNIMVVQDLVKNYGKKKAAPGCMLKIDISWHQDLRGVLYLLNTLVFQSVPKAFRQLNVKC